MSIPLKPASYVRVPSQRGKAPDTIGIEPSSEGQFVVTVGEHRYEVSAWKTPSGLALIHNGRVRDLHLERRDETVRVSSSQGRIDVPLLDARTWTLRTAMGADAGAMKPQLNSPMAGRVVLVKVAPGEEVHKDQTLVIIEAMKMENEIRATASARIKDIRVKAGDVVAAGDVLLAFEVESV